MVATILLEGGALHSGCPSTPPGPELACGELVEPVETAASAAPGTMPREEPPSGNLARSNCFAVQEFGPGWLYRCAGWRNPARWFPSWAVRIISTTLFSLSGQVAVVIGGTGELCGAMAEGLAGAGAEVVLVGRNEKKAGARLARIAALGAAGAGSTPPRPRTGSNCRACSTPCSSVRAGWMWCQRRRHEFRDAVPRDRRGGVRPHHAGELQGRVSWVARCSASTWSSAAREARSSISVRCRAWCRCPGCSPTRRARPRCTTSARTWRGNGRPRTCG